MVESFLTSLGKSVRSKHNSFCHSSWAWGCWRRWWCMTIAHGRMRLYAQGRGKCVRGKLRERFVWSLRDSDGLNKPKCTRVGCWKEFSTISNNDIKCLCIHIERRLVLVWYEPWCRIESTGNSVELWDREYSGLWFYPGESEEKKKKEQINREKDVVAVGYYYWIRVCYTYTYIYTLSGGALFSDSSQRLFAF